MKYQITVYHNDLQPALPYQDGQPLSATVNLWCSVPASSGPLAAADGAYELLRADLGRLQALRHIRRDGECEFLAACVYRLLGLRPPRVGDVFEVRGPDRRWWLARELFTWKHIRPPSTCRQPRSADIRDRLHPDGAVR